MGWSNATIAGHRWPGAPQWHLGLAATPKKPSLGWLPFAAGLAVKPLPHLACGDLQDSDFRHDDKVTAWIRTLFELLKQPVATREGRRIDRRRLRKVIPLLRPHAKPLVVTALLTIPATLLTIPQPYLSRYVVDDVLISRDWAALRWIAPLYLALLVGAALVGWFQSVYSFQLQQRALADIQATLFSHVLKLPKAYFDSKQTGYLLSRVASDTRTLEYTLAEVALSIGPAALQTAGAMGAIFYLNWRMAAVTLLVCPAMILLAKLLTRKLRGTAHETFEKDASVHEEMEQSLSGVALLKVFAAEERQQRQLERKLDESVEANIRHNLLESFTSSAISMIFGAAVLLVVGVGAGEIFQDRITIGEFTAFCAYLVMLYVALNRSIRTAVVSQTALVALDRIAEVLSLQPEGSNNGSKRRSDRIEGRVRFENVSFSYDGSNHVLNDVNWSCRPGEVIALVGPSGAGKTTLVSLIIQLYQPGEGRIYLDGVDCRLWDLSFVRKRIGFVSQEVFLWATSIAENILFGRPNASREEMERVAVLSGADEFIQRLPEKYETLVGERGVKLSAGERQRISLARTLLKNPDILILDEPTSSVDALTEAHIRDALRKHFKECTTFIIAHRLSTACWADRILVMNQGAIIAQGAHEELLQTCAFYKESWDKQRWE